MQHIIGRWMVAIGLVLALTGCDTPWFKLEWAPVDLSQPRAHTASQVLGADGQPIGALQINRHEPVTREQLPDQLIAALTSAEDRRFFVHNGIDLRGIARAFKANQEEGRVVQGGSTITQQLVKNLYLDASDKTISRKAREANMAMKLEELKSKDEILTDYCNSVYMGNGAYGMQAGAKLYFNTPLEGLTLDQIALLVGILRRPEGANPYTNPEGALTERRRVLAAMHEVGHIDEPTFAALTATPLTLSPKPEGNGQRYPRIMEAVRRQIVDSAVLGWGEEDAMNRLFSNGYTIKTTINPAMQEAAEQASRQFLSGNQPESAIVLMDPANGHIRAMVGGRDFEANQFDLATQARRQPGSVFKVVGLAAALEAGLTPTHTYDAGPGEATLPSGEQWTFKSAQPPGPMNLADALVVSSNGVYARLGLDLGGQQVAAMASTLGVRDPQETNPSNILGGVDPGVSALDMATVFATLANHGVRHTPVLVTSIVDQYGNELLTPPPPGEQVVSAHSADTVTSIMERVITEGTGKRAAMGRPAAGKTGTVNNNTDAWFVGYTPNLVGAVWVGYPDAPKPLTVRGFGAVQGGNLPAAIWASAMQKALANTPPVSFDYQSLGTPTHSTPGSGASVTPAPAVTATPEAQPTPLPSLDTSQPVTFPSVTMTASPSPYRPEPVLGPNLLPSSPPSARPMPASPAPAVPPPSPVPAPSMASPSTPPAPQSNQPQHLNPEEIGGSSLADLAGAPPRVTLKAHDHLPTPSSTQ